MWELADRCRLEEKRLRYVLKVEDEALQLQLVRLIVEKNLSAERVQQAVESGTLEAFLSDEGFGKSHAGSEETISERVATRWPSLASQVAKADLTVVADQWIRRQRPEEVRAQLAALRKLIEIVEKRIRR